MFKTRENKKGKKDKKGKSFTLHHCWTELEHDEKWTSRDAPTKKNVKINIGDFDVGDDDSSEDEDTFATSVAKTMKPMGRQAAKEKMKGKKTGDDDIQQSCNILMESRRKMNGERKAMEERRAAIEERRVAAKELKAQTESEKLAMDEAQKAMQAERELMFMDTSSYS
jgi:hypothetical protein